MLCDQNAAAADRYKPSDICVMRAAADAEDGDVYVYAFDFDLNRSYEGGIWGWLFFAFEEDPEEGRNSGFPNIIEC